MQEVVSEVNFCSEEDPERLGSWKTATDGDPYDLYDLCVRTQGKNQLLVAAADPNVSLTPD